MKVQTAILSFAALAMTAISPAFAKHHHHKHHHASSSKSAPDASNATQNGDNKQTETGGQPGGATGRQ